MILTLDVENTTVKRNKKLHLDPFEPENSLVMVGMLGADGTTDVITFDHADVEPTPDGHKMVQDTLDLTTLLIAHNATHDLVWLWESGFTYDGPVYDTMLGEYVLQRGQKEPLSLEACAERHELETQKQDSLKAWLKDGNSVREMPHDELSSYLISDLQATYQLYQNQSARYEGAMGLIPTLKLTQQLVVHLARIYQRGFKVDMEELYRVKDDFERERNELLFALEEQASDLMGDRPINVNSTEQLSMVI